VKGISFNVLNGEVFSLLGPNGAGKTTTISMLSCLIQPTEGTATIQGHSITGNPMAVKQVIGIVPQEIALYDQLTARQNLTFWGRMHGLGGRVLQRRIDEVLEQVNLTDRANERVENYSGGMKRRINIGIGLLHRPALLFMDEPTVGIDPQSRRRILDTVRELRNQGMTVLYTTHYMEEAEELSDRVAIIDHGRLIALGTQKELTKMIGEQETLRLHLADGAEVDAVVGLFTNLPGVSHVASTDGEIVLNVPEAEEALPGVISRANDADLRIRSIDIEQPNLEAVFLHLTGRALRD
jgi:ABC-2 type transport system ATP-binding protein